MMSGRGSVGPQSAEGRDGGRWDEGVARGRLVGEGHCPQPPGHPLLPFLEPLRPGRH